MYMAQKYGMEICDIPALDMLSEGTGNFKGIEKCRRVFPHLHKGEGHFAALLKKPGTSERQTEIKTKRNAKRNAALDDAVKLWRGFEKEAMNIRLDGEFVLFGDNLYLMPEAIAADKLKIVRCGLHLGTVKKGRIEPAHALSHAFCADAYKNVLTYHASDPALAAYMNGQTLTAGIKGWCVIAVRGSGIGWGKASGGTVKNHYPKSLRTFVLKEY